MAEPYAGTQHRLLGQRVRDIASGVEGELMGVVEEDVPDGGVGRRVRLARLRDTSGLEFTTALGNIVPAAYIDALESRAGYR
ncbi:hypothetical protein CP980_13595 [Streptomyces vinaceus]|uniref:Uncharacterized protein n=1 Tax=Streptomyces vinaceus TaxID=1960 RepID=A0A5J6JB91_STRVI|nr:hypothetical protein [Streptomyces vinaceus]QEV45994.1 hypothetical protein CP980_13595 [Streptomyces vinaceus]GHE48395.1 hypothetical protein GCM10017778_35400 [Streptomyces vinaceus]